MPPTQPPNPPILPDERPPIAEDDDLLEPGENQLLVIHRHPIGIVYLYLAALTGVIVLGAFLFLVAPNFLNTLANESSRLLLGGIVLAIAILLFVLFVATVVYRESRLLVTDRSLVQIIQKGLFGRKVSRLNFANVEDVSAEQKGILPTIFNYGTLIGQTAGSLDNFIFSYCPSPNRYADQIIEARQRYAQSVQEEGRAGPIIR